MRDPANVTAIKQWLGNNRPDLISQFDQIFTMPVPRGDAFILIMAVCFEAGRMYQSERKLPDVYTPMADYTAYED